MLQRSIMELHRSVPYRVERVVPPNNPDAALELERREMPVRALHSSLDSFLSALMCCVHDNFDLTAGFARADKTWRDRQEEEEA